MKRVRRDGGGFEGGGGLVGVQLDEADEGIDSGGERGVPDDVVVWGLHDCSFEGGDGMFSESGSHGVSECG